MYYWVWKVTTDGKLAVFSPPYLTQEEASQYGFMHFGANFEIKELNTKDRAEATRAIKRTVFETTYNLEQSLQRARHNKPEVDY